MSIHDFEPDTEAETTSAVRVDTRPIFSSHEFNRVSGAAVIVENWQRKANGSVKRAFEETFGFVDRVTLLLAHEKIRKWQLRDGTPNEVRVSLSTLAILQRCARFFCTH
jgi:hypothetical protein